MVVQISEVLCYLLCRLDIICITALLFSTTLCNYPVLSFQEYGVYKVEQIFMNAYMYLAMLGNQLLSPVFADYISILSKLRQNTADIQGIRMDYHYKMLFL